MSDSLKDDVCVFSTAKLHLIVQLQVSFSTFQLELQLDMPEENPPSSSVEQEAMNESSLTFSSSSSSSSFFCPTLFYLAFILQRP